MDVSVLAASAVALLSPYLVMSSEEFAKKVGGVAAEGVGKLFALIKGKLTGPVAELETTPSDEDQQTLLRLQLKKALKADPEFAATLKALVDDVAKNGGAPVAQMMNVTGGNNQSIQVSGSNNVINK